MTFRQFMGIVEIRTKIVSISTLLLGNLLVVTRTGRWNPLTGILLIIAVLLVDMGTTGFNTYFDYRRGTDSSKYNREKSKVIVHEGVPWGVALLVSVCLFAAALPIGFVLFLLTGWPVLAVGLFGMAVGFFYTGGPRPISGTPLGEIFAGGSMGTVMFLLAWYVQAGKPDAITLFCSLPSTFCIGAILTVNNTCDILGDKAAGRKTISVLLGRKWGEWTSILQVSTAMILASFIPFVGVGPTWSTAIPLLFFALAVREMTKMHHRGYSHQTKEGQMGSISQILGYYTLATAGVYVSEIAYTWGQR